MPEWIIAMFLIGALLSAGDMAKIFLEARRSRREAAVYDNHPQKLQMEHYADSFRVLAESFYQMPSKSVMPETGRVDKILEKEQQEVCSRCAKASWCWEQYGNLTRERCQELLQTIADGDEDEISRAKGEWNASCLKGSRFLELFWNRYQQERQTALWSGRVAESRRVVAEQLSEVAWIMDRAACDLYSLNSLPDELSEKICRQMKKNGAFVQKIWLQERPKEHLQIYMTVKAGRHCRITLRQTAELIGSLCGIPMVAVRDGAQVLSGEYQTVLFQEDVKFQVLYGVGRITKEQESISGDNYSVLCENGQFVLCLSDGMGSGIEANRESETVVELFEQFLRAGFPRIMAARMINSMLLLQPKEGMFSTFDVASINLYTGVCSFLKGGASPTFLRRDTWVEVVESTSLAAGLVSQTDFDTTTKKLYDGDYLVMMTDGVLDALPGDRTEQMKQLLLEVKNSEPREFARELLERVLRLGGCRARDDMTVLVARIWKK